ncbi:E1 ubiquitin-activating protein uba2 [Ptychographa xylographoides]|nr:E1 ubiquitin-activating protein uba2 [Ptychographa xylographoides]
MARDRFRKQSLGALYGKIKTAHVLMVGAGGIGCELLKNLLLTGFGEIHIVDLDTIDLSNLNRQFLFRHEHIKKSKALVAKESAQRFNPDVKLVAHHANIKDTQFNINWFQQFDLVFNALDNLDARRHVNKMCLAANIPLIESGTTGFKGQVQVIKKGVTECYDCNEKEVPKSFPVCTIRSTPSQPIHCIVWAKSYLFTEIFGTSEDEIPEFDHSEDAENVKELETLNRESQMLQKIRQSIGSPEFAQQVFHKVFTDDINRLRSMEDMWKTRTPPEPLNFGNILADSEAIDISISSQDQQPWTLTENFVVFLDSLRRLSERAMQQKRRTADGISPLILSFDKDDEDSLDFVAATANLRSLVFGIDPRSKFDIKQMAGNIIPAIATTNAMTAGLCVLQAFKVLRDQLGRAKMVFLEHSAARVINTDTLKPPNPNCGVCGVAQSKLVVDTNRATLNDLVEDVLKQHLGYGEEFSVNNEVGTLYDPELDDNLPKKFRDLGIKADSFLTIIDDDDSNPRVNLTLAISEQSLPESTKPILLPERLKIARKPRSNGASQVNGSEITTNGVDKRKRSREEVDASEDPDTKRRNLRMDKTDREDFVLIEEKGNGAIVIDDD